MGLREVSDATFEQDVLLAEKPVVVDFWAPWCQPCLALSPIIEQVASAQSEMVDFVKLNTDDNQRTAAAFGIQSIPTVILFKSGKEISRTLGFMPVDKLTEWLTRAKSEAGVAETVAAG